MKYISVLVIVMFSLLVQAQSFNGAAGSIPDSNYYKSFNVNVNGLGSTINTSSFGLEYVRLRITHPYIGDLKIKLRAPDGTEVVLAEYTGGGGANFNTTTFKNNAPLDIANGTAPFNGTYRPVGDLSAVNNGQNGNGVWRLLIKDADAGDVGFLNSWSVKFSTAPTQAPIEPFANFSSNLPILKINTVNNTAIQDDPKISADFKIIYNGAGVRNYDTNTVYNFVGKIGIEQRGSSSATFPKKSYGFETWDTASNELDTSLLSLPSESDWILSASYTDKSFLNNRMTYDFARQMGWYASRCVYVELVLNGQYKGLYVLMEKIKRDENRVNVAKLKTNDTAGTALTGGYIFKIDKFTGSGGDGWYSQVTLPTSSPDEYTYFQYEYPKADSMQPQQKTYIKNYVDSFELSLNGANYQNPLTGFRKYANERSFIDYEILNEISKNVDGYRLSTYLHKEKVTDGNKIKMGPVWDYDISYYNADYCGGDDPTGWGYNFTYICGAAIPFWWERLMEDSVYQKKLFCRYTTLRQTGFLNTDSVNNYIDSTAALLDEAQQRNFTKWPILGTQVWPNPTPVPTTYLGEIQELKTWFTDRFAWLDNAIAAFAYSLNTPIVLQNKPLCAGDSVVLNTADTYSKYNWSNTQTVAQINISSAGNYSVVVQDEYGCSTSGTIQINQVASPVVELGADKISCSLDSTLLSGPANQASSNWNTGDTTTEITVSSGTYVLRVTNADGCAASDTITVALQTVNANFTAFSNSLYQYSFTVSHNSGNTYNWNFGDSTFSTLVNPEHLYLVEGTYIVRLEVTDSLGCVNTSTDTIFILASSLPLQVLKEIKIYPNPVNGVLSIELNNGFVNKDVSIYNNFGQQVYKAKILANYFQINMTEYRAGVYVLHIADKVYKVVKK